MDEVQRHRVKRRGLKGSVTKLLSKVEDVFSTRLEEANIDSTQESKRILVSTTVMQLNAKMDQIKRLDELIAASIQAEEELESEVCNADSYLTTLEERIAYLAAFIERTSQQSTPSSPRENTEEPPHQSAGETADTTRVNSESPHINASETHNYSRLPKLVLPTFSGDPLKWQSFWDSFSAAVHSNPNLTGAQKLNHLRTQLQGEASDVIGGFQLTDSNYVHSVDLLKERYGQEHKLVDAHMEALLNLTAPSHNLRSLQSFYNVIQIHIRALSSLNTPSESYGPLLTTAIFTKLPQETRTHIARDHYGSKWTINDLLSSISKEIQIFEASQRSSYKVNSYSNPIPTTGSFHTAANNHSGTPRDKLRKDIRCIFCKGAHKSSLCSTIISHKDRLAIVKNSGLCFNCLARHKISQCPSKFTCKECHKKHHTSLCHAFTTQEESQPTPPHQISTPSLTSATQQTSTTATTANLTNTTQQLSAATVANAPISALHTSVCLLKTAIADISSGPSGHLTVEGNILFDEGAQRSFITQGLADQLNLQPTSHENISVSSFGAKVSTVERLAVTSIFIHTLNDIKIPVSVLIVPELAAPIRNSVRTHLNQLPYLQDLPLAHPVTSDENFHISVLIGADFYWRFIQDHVVRGDGPTAVASRLGYLLSGPLPLSTSVTTSCVHVSSLSCITEGTNHDTFWKVESVGTTTQKQNSDSEFLTTYIATKITVEPDGSYSLKFPWKSNHPPLPSNYTICAKRTRSMAYRLMKTPALLRMYGAIIEDQERRGFIERVKGNLKHTAAAIHYIPHHPVKKDSSTTPIRIVYDCSCRQSSDSPSLNDCLDPGPPFLMDLCTILLRFRQHKFAFSSDIEKAFLHVHLDQTDRDVTRFLWLSDPTDANSPFITYRFKVVLFGATCSPFMLNAALIHHLSQNDSDVARDILQNLYVDNLVSGCQTEQGALKYFLESRTLLRNANFNLRSWTSNSRQLMSAAKENNAMETSNPVKVLGIVWDAQLDLIFPSPKPEPINFTFARTKRAILKCTSSIFDPLGLITPVTISVHTTAMATTS